MVLDIILLIILVLTIYFSMRKGLVMTVVNFAKGFASLVVAWLFCGKVSDWLMNKTEAGTIATQRISETLTSKWETSDFYMALPDLFKEGDFGNISSSLITDGAVKLSGALLTILCFVLIVVALRLVLSIIGRLFSHNHRGGFTGLADWFLGGVLGLILGFLYIFVFLALLVPVAGIIVPEHCATIMGWLDSSLVAGELYNNNLLLILFRDFLV